MRTHLVRAVSLGLFMAATVFTAASHRAEAAPLCSSLNNISLSSFTSCVAPGNDNPTDVQNILNAVLAPDVDLINGYFAGPSASSGVVKLGSEFTGDNLAVGFNITPNSVAGTNTFTFVSLPTSTDFIIIKQATNYEIFNVVGLSPGFTLTHSLSPSGGTSHISTYNADITVTSVPEPATLALLGAGLLGLGLVRRRRG